MARTVFIFLTLILLFSCSDPQKKPIKIAINPWPGYEFLYLAQRLDLYKKANLQVEIIQVSTLADGQRAYLNGLVDGFASTLVEAVQVEALGAPPLEIVLLADYSNGGDVILANKTFTSINDLKGATIGCEVNSLGLYFLARALEKYNLSISDVSIKNVEQSQGLDALNSKEIDAFISYPPYSLKVLADPQYQQIFSSAAIPTDILDVVSISKAVLIANPDLKAKLQHVWTLALDYHKQHPDKANQIMAQREGITVEEFKDTLNDLKTLDISEQRAIVKTNRVSELALSVCHTLTQVNSISSDCAHTEHIINMRTF